LALLQLHYERLSISFGCNFRSRLEKLLSRFSRFAFGGGFLRCVHSVKLGVGIDLILVNAHRCTPSAATVV